jgi:hypothetical protein
MSTKEVIELAFTLSDLLRQVEHKSMLHPDERSMIIDDIATKVIPPLLQIKDVLSQYIET